MNSHIPSISVVCPTYNSETFIDATLKSVFEQTIRPFEFIIADDGSNDNTVSRIKRASTQSPIPIVILRLPHRGPGAARNAAIRIARGKWIAFLDSDDYWKAEKIQRIIDCIISSRSINFICHNEICINANGSEVLYDYASHYSSSLRLIRQLYRRNLFSPSAVVCRKNLLLKNGLFDETFMVAQDYELWLRLSPYIQPYFLRDYLGYYIMRDTSNSSLHSMLLCRNSIRALKKHKKLVSITAYYSAVLRAILAYAKKICRLT